MDIIVKIEQCTTLVTLDDGEFVDPNFLTLSSMTTKKFHFYSPEMIAEKITHQLKGVPDDLKSHVQRLQIMIKQKKPVTVYANLVELFLILGNDGGALRQRMLESAKEVLLKGHYDELRPSVFLGLESTFFKKKRGIINFINKIELEGAKNNER